MRLDDLPLHTGPVEVVTCSSSIGGLLSQQSGSCRRIEDGLRTVEPKPTTRLASLPEERAAAEELVRRRYAWRGYRIASASERECASSCSSRDSVTLLAEGSGRLLGTLTVGLDDRSGLLAAKTYAPEIDHLRLEGRRLGELTRLAIERGVDWKAALDALVQGAWLITRAIHALTDVVIEVNPRHVPFYQRVFGFESIGAGRVCERVGAPSVLLRLDLELFGLRMKRAGMGY